ncbi:Rqc2 family fibronectin-binding protein [Microaceticoccus formicicus]|uniref:Rqc2 family fibronectin-binding protein n=1 Tax=Microaceticoccus formicicus TaxID=3118105 RepID=UPI003CD01D7B|nr:NFACT RNA binding domain-containing protein [Peptoniphilaceae bacterium AMB_02]
MSFDGITTRSIISELSKMVGARINRVNQPESLDIILILHKGVTKNLLLTANSNVPRFHIINDTPKNPMTPPNFCMVLRKHIQGGIVKSISQYKLDRVVKLEISTYDEMGYPCVKSLVIEIMGRHSNIILLDDNNKIIDSIKRVTMDMSRIRQILPGATYNIIEDDKKDLLKEDVLPSQLFDFTKSNAAYKSFYMNYTGLSPLISKEIIYRSGLDVDIKLNNLEKLDIENIDNEFIKIRNLIRDKDFKPYLLLSLTGDKAVGFYPIEINHLGGQLTTNETMSQVLEEYYGTKDNSDRLNQMISNILKVVNNRIKRSQNKLIQQISELEESQNRDIYKVYADLISANIHLINRGVESVKLQNFYTEDLETLDIPLDIKLSPQQNAQHYYKKYSKLKKTEEVLSDEIPKLKEEINYLNQVKLTLSSITEVDEIQEIREELSKGGYLKLSKAKSKNKSSAPSKPLKFITSDGLNVYVGKNNRQNDELTLKFASKSDLFFHAQKVPGAHVILKTDSKEISDKSIYEAAYLAAKYSSLKDENQVMIDYTEKKNVYKAKGAKPGMVYYNDFKSILVDLSDQSILRGIEIK